MSTIRNLCVYCGSSPGRVPVYADAVLERGGRAVGVIPEALVAKEVAHHGLTELHVTRNMHERKAAMAELSDAFVALPGGIGTLEEIFEIWTWAQLGFHAKPCGLLNAGGYYDDLARFLDHTVAEEFVRGPHRAMLLVERDPVALLERLAAYVPPVVPKWVERADT